MPKAALFPVVLVLCVIGAYALNNTMANVYVLLAFGVLGYAMVKFGFPLAPFILGVILGDQIEINLVRSIMTDSNPWLFLTRPISGVLLAASVLSIAAALWQHRRMQKKSASPEATPTSSRTAAQYHPRMRLARPVAAGSDLAAAQSIEPRATRTRRSGRISAGATAAQVDVGDSIASAPLQDGESKVHSLLLGYVRSLDVFGNAGSIALLLPVVDLAARATLNGTAEVNREISGLGDPALRLAWNFYGAPALSAKDFAGYRQDLIVGTSVVVTAPLGQYDPARLVNIGTNRWSVKPELGLSKALDVWTVEFAAGVTFFTRNDEFFNGNTRTRIRSTRRRCT